MQASVLLRSVLTGVACFLGATTVSAQSAPSDSAAVVASVRRYIAAMSARDTAYLRAASLSTMATVSIASTDGAITVRTLDDFLSGMASNPRVLSGVIWAPAVSIDGPIARLVAPYVTSFDGVVSHCGTDHYVMVWSGGRWLASQMVFTRRTEGCVAPR